jgi:hypothetical protein
MDITSILQGVAAAAAVLLVVLLAVIPTTLDR